MSINMVRNVLDNSTLPARARLVLAIIAEHADEDGLAWPCRQTIARKAATSVRNVSRLIRLCRDAGELEVVEFGVGRGRSNRYRVRVTESQKGDTCVPFSGGDMGDATVTLSSPNGDTADTLCGGKGDGTVTLSEGERVTMRDQRVTNRVEKGDSQSPQTTKNHQEPPPPQAVEVVELLGKAGVGLAAEIAAELVGQFGFNAARRAVQRAMLECRGMSPGYLANALRDPARVGRWATAEPPHPTVLAPVSPPSAEDPDRAAALAWLGEIRAAGLVDAYRQEAFARASVLQRNAWGNQEPEACRLGRAMHALHRSGWRPAPSEVIP
jgi:hypothetical protein